MRHWIKIAGFLLLRTFIFLATIEILLRLGGGAYLFIQKQKVTHEILQQKAYRILCIGDSLTAFSDYPEILSEELNKQGYKFDVVIDKVGIPSVDSAFLVNSAEKFINEYKPDMVIFLAGLGDFYHSKTEKRKMDMELTPTENQVNSADKLRAFDKIAPSRDIRDLRLKDLLSKIWDQLKKKEFLHKAKANYEKQMIVHNASGHEYDQYMALGNTYLYLKDYKKAQEVYERAMGLLPQPSIDALMIFDHFYKSREFGYAKYWIDLAEKQNMLGSKAIYYAKGASVYQHLKEDVSEYESWLLKMIGTISPSHITPVLDLVDSWILKGEYAKGIEYLKNYLEKNKTNDLASQAIYMQLAELFLKAGNLEQAKVAMKNVIEINGGSSVYFNKLQQITMSHGIKLVLMQYPSWPVSFLKKKIGDDENIIFIDNEMLFKKFTLMSGYFNCFNDVDGVWFGHLNREGSVILAYSIFQGISEYLNQENLTYGGKEISVVKQ